MKFVAGLFVVCIFAAANLGSAEEPSDENGIQFNKLLLDEVEKNVAKAAKEEDQIQALVKEIQRLKKEAKKEAKEGEQKRAEAEQKRAEEAKQHKTEIARLKAKLRKASKNFKNLKSVKGLNNRAADASPSNNSSMNGTVRAASELNVVLLKAPGPIQYHWVKTYMNYTNARAYCKKNFNVGDLASFPSDRDLQQIQKQVADKTSWVGGYCNKNDPNACEAAQGTTGWRWVSGEPIPINAHGNTEWFGNEPVVNGKAYNLVFANVAAGVAPLVAIEGNAKYFFICSTTTS